MVSQFSGGRIGPWAVGTMGVLAKCLPSVVFVVVVVVVVVVGVVVSALFSDPVASMHWPLWSPNVAKHSLSNWATRRNRNCR